MCQRQLTDFSSTYCLDDRAYLTGLCWVVSWSVIQIATPPNLLIRVPSNMAWFFRSVETFFLKFQFGEIQARCDLFALKHIFPYMTALWPLISGIACQSVGHCSTVYYHMHIKENIPVVPSILIHCFYCMCCCHSCHCC